MAEVGNKNLYIRADDRSQRIWALAEEEAERKSVSLSHLVTNALEEYLRRRGIVDG